jgi:hypothetical protein
MKHPLILCLLPCLAAAAEPRLLFESDFVSDQRSSWAVRKVDAATAGFGNNSLFLRLGPANPQPIAAFHGFDEVALVDGQSLELSFEVACADPADKPRSIRFALGHTTAPIRGMSSRFEVPMCGFQLTLPSGESNRAPRLFRIDTADKPVNFFRAGGENLGDMPAGRSASVSANWTVVQFVIKRVGDTLEFTGEFAGNALRRTLRTPLPADGVGQRWNVLGLAYINSPEQTVAFRKVRLQLRSPVQVEQAAE